MNSFLIKTLANSLRQQTSSVLIKLEYSSGGSGGGPGDKDNELFSAATKAAAAKTDTISNQVKKSVNISPSSGKIGGESKQLNERVAFLNSKSIKFDYGWNNLQLNLCKQADNEFFLNSETGDFHCLKCKKNGDWNEFQSLVPQFNENIDCNFSQVGLLSSHLIASAKPVRNIPNLELWQKSTPINQVDSSHYKILIRNSSLDTDFSRSTLERHDIRIMDSKALYPVYDDDGELNELVVVDSNDRDEEHINHESIYGRESLKQDTKMLFITDKIKNMLAINEMIKKPAIVVNSLSSLTPKLLVHLEKYDTIIFLHRDMKLALSIAQAINHTRCYLTNYAKSPFESLQLKEDFWKIVEREKFSLKNNTLIKFDELKESVYDRILNAKKYSGVKWKRFQILNEILKGHRTGELTIFTGPTGSGKTTFLSEYSLDLTMQGVRTLWGSFEIQNHRLAKLMMTQFAGMNLYNNIALFESISQQFSSLPIYFMNFHGQESVENVLKTMSNAVVLYDINHIIIDNLQFMIGSQFPNAFDKYNQQDLIIGAFRRFATNFNCHITIVIHPKKEEGDDLLKISSVFGSAKSTQEADNVIILQVSKTAKEERGSFLKFIEVCKNRYDGELGKMMIRFDKEKLSFITKKIYRDDSFSKWKDFKHGEGKTMAILNNQSDLTNSNNLEIDDDAIQLKNFPPSLIK